jgi:hypothetical protein
MFPITAGLGALSYLTSLLQSSTSKGSTPSDALTQLTDTLDANQSQSTSNSVGSGGTTPPYDAGTLAGLLSLQQQSSSGASGHSGLYSTLDTDGDGQVSQSDLESALGADGVDTSSADALFNKLDLNGDGNISKGELYGARHHYSRLGHLASALNNIEGSGATSSSATNTDGSTTTTITYANGSTVSMTMPAATSGSSGSGTSPAMTPMEKWIQLQSMVLPQTSSTVSTVA